MSWIWTLMVGAIIGAVASGLVDKRNSKGCVFNIIAGLLGSSLGHRLFGADLGGHAAGMAIIPSILGAVIVVAIVSLVTRR